MGGINSKKRSNDIFDELESGAKETLSMFAEHAYMQEAVREVQRQLDEQFRFLTCGKCAVISRVTNKGGVFMYQVRVGDNDVVANVRLRVMYADKYTCDTSVTVSSLNTWAAMMSSAKSLAVSG